MIDCSLQKFLVLKEYKSVDRRQKEYIMQASQKLTSFSFRNHNTCRVNISAPEVICLSTFDAVNRLIVGERHT